MRNLLLVSLLALVLSGCGTKTEVIKISTESSSPAILASEVVSSSTASNKSASSSDSLTDSKAKLDNTLKTSTVATPTSLVIPSSLVLKVLFAQQAPFGNWDAIHEETCEEASMIMAAKYFNKEPLDEKIMEEELQKLLAWENERGYKVDLSAQEMAGILKDYFGLKAAITKEATVERIKYELVKGNLIVIPVAGRVLNNPNFKQPGPIYHALVIKGYNSKEIITNDPGTRKGNGFSYSYANLIEAIHDWQPSFLDNGSAAEKILTGEKAMIIINK